MRRRVLSENERNRLQDLTASDIRSPDYVVVTYAVCSVDENACGWAGWLLEGVFAISEDKSGILANGDNPLPSVSLQICPNCGGTVFRTDTAQPYYLKGAGTARMKAR
jgi:hypothetical protein